MQATSIEWTDMSVNPIRARRKDGGQRVPGHYCEKISSGCANCYASRMQRRFGMPGFPGAKKGREAEAQAMQEYQGVPGDLVQPFLDERCLRALLRSRKISGKKVFVCDMTDMFGSWVPDAWLDEIFAVFALRPDVIWQVLTKRPGRMADFVQRGYYPIVNAIQAMPMEYRTHRSGLMWETANEWPLPNVWLGCSVENQVTADGRIPKLLQCPAAVRFLSVEPLLGAVNVFNQRPWCRHHGAFEDMCMDMAKPCFQSQANSWDMIDWVIVGGESGAGLKTRAMDPDWVRMIRDQCMAAGVPFFFKQWGDWIGGKFDSRKGKFVSTAPHDVIFWTNPGHPDLMFFSATDESEYWTRAAARVGKRKAGRVLDGRTWDEMPGEAVRA